MSSILLNFGQGKRSQKKTVVINKTLAIDDPPSEIQKEKSL
ncbi:hypothetical protein NIES2104_64400 [Leptolyngbya sp. NIES-2104]|nr:hypothetical protein NIES2104_64400 [Leptolyngbya sp. NIES-2104]